MAFKVARLRESIIEGHDELILCKSSNEEVGLEVRSSCQDDNQNQVVLVLHTCTFYLEVVF